MLEAQQLDSTQLLIAHPIKSSLVEVDHVETQIVGRFDKILNTGVFQTQEVATDLDHDIQYPFVVIWDCYRRKVCIPR